MPDTVNPSASPVFRDPANAGNGGSTIILNANAVTEGYVATYSAVNRRWTLAATVNGNINSNAAPGPGQPAAPFNWTMNIANQVNVVFGQGGAAYAANDIKRLDVFRSTRVGGKVNVIDLGSLSPTAAGP